MARFKLSSHLTFLWFLSLCFNRTMAQLIPTSERGSQITNITALPAALPTGGNLDPCAFTDREILLNSIESDWQSYNVSLLVATCDSVYFLVYSAGNPNISRIGYVSTLPTWPIFGIFEGLKMLPYSQQAYPSAGVHILYNPRHSYSCQYYY